MARWFSFVRSQEQATASVSVDVGIDAANAIPEHPTAFLLVRRIEDGADPEPLRALEEGLATRLDAAGAMFVATLTMSGSRALVVYGTTEDEPAITEAVNATGVLFAVQKQDDPQWQLYRTLLPSEEEMRS